MHDIDSTRLEANPDQNEYFEDQERASEAGEAEDSFEIPMSEEEEEALAAELLGVNSEEEMDQFFGKLFRKLRPRIGGAISFLSQHAGPLTAALKGIARKALPLVGSALGSAIPIPGVGTALGGAVGTAASNLLEMETDEMEVEEREFEIAKRFVRLASHTVRQGARMRAARFNARNASNLALRYSLQRLRRFGGFRSRPIYRPCPPCPVCAQPLVDNDLADHATEPMASSPPPSSDTATGAPATGGGEFEFEDAREFEDRGELEESGELEEGNEVEGENYETDHETFTPPASGGGRSGRWIRRGRKIILYGL